MKATDLYKPEQNHLWSKTDNKKSKLCLSGEKQEWGVYKNKNDNTALLFGLASCHWFEMISPAGILSKLNPIAREINLKTQWIVWAAILQSYFEACSSFIAESYATIKVKTDKRLAASV